MATRYYCDWCGAETCGDNSLNAVAGRTASNTAYLYGKGPLIKVSVNVLAKSSRAETHMCASCLRNALRSLLCGDRVESPEEEPP